MPHYFFHVRSAGDPVKDEKGLTLRNLKEARQKVIRSARDIVTGCVRAGTAIPSRNAVEVLDEAGTTVFVVTFAEAIPVAGNDNP
jgi:hypothetical protein